MEILSEQRLITRSRLDDVLRLQGGVLSVYHSTEKVAVEPEENSLRLKNLVSRAGDRLQVAGLRRPDVDDLLQPLESLVEDRDFWHHQWSGLALFRTKDAFEYFRTPYNVPETIEYADAAAIKPLLPTIWPSERFFLLALSQHEVRLLHCSRFKWLEVELNHLGVPLSLEEALRYDDLQKPELQHHPTTGPGRGPIGQDIRGAAGQEGRRHGFHGHGESGEGQKTQIRRWFQELDKGLQEIFRAETAPLIVAGVDYVYGLWREVARYPNIVDERIQGNVERKRAEELHTKALPIIERLTRAELDGLRERFGAAQTSELASCDLHEVLSAAADGRVDTLFLGGNQVQLGSFDPATRRLELAYEGDVAGVPDEVDAVDDLHELAARLVLRSRGRVYVLGPEEMPCPDAAGGLFRYTS
jgi:hypothetical protein